MANIAIAIPTKNRAETVRRTIEHTLAGMPDSLTLVVLDNGSDDNTTEVIDSFEHPRYYTLHDPRGTHVKDGFLRVLDTSPAEYTILMSDEDRIDWDNYAELERHLDTHPNPPRFLSTVFRHSQGFVRSGTPGPIRPDNWFASSFYCSGLVWSHEAIGHANDLLWHKLHTNDFLKIYAEAGITLANLPYNSSVWYPKEVTRQREQLVTFITMDDGTPYWERQNRSKLYQSYQELLDYLIDVEPEHSDTWNLARHDSLIGSWR